MFKRKLGVAYILPAELHLPELVTFWRLLKTHLFKSDIICSLVHNNHESIN